MRYVVCFKPRALKDIERLPSQIRTRIINKLEEMSDNLKGNVKHLTDVTPEYRLRVGDYRILFEIEEDQIIVYRVHHRREAYR